MKSYSTFCAFDNVDQVVEFLQVLLENNIRLTHISDDDSCYYVEVEALESDIENHPQDFDEIEELPF